MNHLSQAARTVQVVFICSSKQDPPLLSAGPREGPDLPSLSQLNLIFSRPLLLSPSHVITVSAVQWEEKTDMISPVRYCQRSQEGPVTLLTSLDTAQHRPGPVIIFSDFNPVISMYLTGGRQSLNTVSPVQVVIFKFYLVFVILPRQITHSDMCTLRPTHSLLCHCHDCDVSLGKES